MAAGRSASCTSTTSCAPGSRKRQSSSASSRRGKPPNRRLYPALELPQRHLPDHQHAGRAVVEAGYRREILTPVLFEDALTLDCDLLQRFEAIGRKARRDHRHVLHPPLAERLYVEIDPRLQPLSL